MKHHMHLIDFRKLNKLELFITIVGSVEPIFSIPQLVKVYGLQSAEEYTVWNWAFGLFTSACWAFYGVKIKKYPIAITAMLWMIVHGLMTAAVLLYG